MTINPAISPIFVVRWSWPDISLISYCDGPTARPTRLSDLGNRRELQRLKTPRLWGSHQMKPKTSVFGIKVESATCLFLSAL